MTQQKIVIEHKITELLELPKKTHRDVYLAIVERFLLRFPYNVNMDAFKQIGQRIGIGSDLAKQKVIDLEAAGYIEWNNWSLYPIFRINGNREEAVIALRERQGELEKEHTASMSSNEMYALLDTVCPHTRKQRDTELCSMHRWIECKNCKWNVQKPPETRIHTRSGNVITQEDL